LAEAPASAIRDDEGEAAPAASIINPQEQAMAWTKPTFVDIRYGFEITMYIANR